MLSGLIERFFDLVRVHRQASSVPFPDPVLMEEYRLEYRVELRVVLPPVQAVFVAVANFLNMTLAHLPI